MYPKNGSTVKFKNFERLHDVPFVVYADFESFAEQDTNKSFTTKYQNHIPSGFCYVIKCMDDSMYPTKTVIKTASYEGEDMGKAFIDSLTEDIKPVYDILKSPRPMIMSEADKSSFSKSKNVMRASLSSGHFKLANEVVRERRLLSAGIIVTSLENTEALHVTNVI